MIDEAPFRYPGSPYEHEEPVVIAAAPPDRQVDWAPPGRVPDEALWVPEPLFVELHSCARKHELPILGGLNAADQTWFRGAEREALSRELSFIAVQLRGTDAGRAAELMSAFAERFSGSDEERALLIERP